MEPKKVRIVHEHLHKDLTNLYTIFETENECREACLALMKYYEEQRVAKAEGDRDDFRIADRVQVVATEKPVYTAEEFIQTLQ